MIYRSNLRPLYKYIYSFLGSKSETEDVIREVFVKLWMNRENFELTGSLTGYLFRIAKNLTINHFRHLSHVTKYEHHAEYVGNSEKEGNADHKVILNDYYRIAQDAIGRLSPREAQIFKLSTERDMSLQEIADHLGISKSGVKKQLYAATRFGSGSASECWYEGKRFQQHVTKHSDETCVTVTWQMLSEQLLKLTGAAKYADAIERSYYNALLGAMTADGSNWGMYTPSMGIRSLGSDQCNMGLNCCTANGPRGLWNTSINRNAYWKRDSCEFFCGWRL